MIIITIMLIIIRNSICYVYASWAEIGLAAMFATVCLRSPMWAASVCQCGQPSPQCAMAATVCQCGQPSPFHVGNRTRKLVRTRHELEAAREEALVGKGQMGSALILQDITYTILYYV